MRNKLFREIMPEEVLRGVGWEEDSMYNAAQEAIQEQQELRFKNLQVSVAQNVLGNSDH